MEHEDTRSAGEPLVTAMRELLTGRPNPEDPLPPGPWDPVILTAVRRTLLASGPAALASPSDTLPAAWRRFLGPVPDPWGSLFDAGPNLWRVAAARHPALWDLFGDPLALVGLNPQPLPPRTIFVSAIAETVIQTAELAQRISSFGQRTGEAPPVGHHVARYVDEYCGTGFRIKAPLPPPPPPWLAEELGATDFVVMGVRFEQAAARSFDPDLGKAFRRAARQLMEVGLGRK